MIHECQWKVSNRKRYKPQPGLQNNPSHRGVMGLAHLIPALLVLTLLLGACSKKKEETDDTTTSSRSTAPSPRPRI